MKRLGPALVALWLFGCGGIPNGVRAVDDFEVERYLGQWYEIARFDHSFERGLSRVTATYSRRADGGIDVVNRGYDAAAGRWEEARGRAYLVEGPDVGKLRVTFFWPFYGGYNVIALDHSDYRYAMVCGPTRNYLWILARQKMLEEDVMRDLVALADRLGFATGKLIVVEQ